MFKAMRCFSLCVFLLVLESSARWSGRSKGHRHHYGEWLPSWMQEQVEDYTARDASGMPKWQRKLCKSAKKFGFVPGLHNYCGETDANGEFRSHHSDHFKKSHRSTDWFKSKFEAEQDKTQRLNRELEIEKADKKRRVKDLEKEKEKVEHEKERLGAKARDFEKDQRMKEQELRKVQGRIREMEKDNQEKEHQLRKDKKQAEHMKSKLEGKVREMEVEVTHLKSRLDTKVRELAREKAGKQEKASQLERYRLVELEVQIEDERRRASQVSAELKEARAELTNNQDQLAQAEKLASQMSIELKSARAELESMQHQLTQAQKMSQDSLLHNVSVVASQINTEKKHAEDWAIAFASERKLTTMLATVITSMAVAMSLWSWKLKKRFVTMEQEFNSEFGGMTKMDQLSRNLGTDFEFYMFDERTDQQTVRSVKIQCPGVRHADVSVEIIFNGCIVTINREASQGVAAAAWTKKFQFRPSEGMFEFVGDEASLESGYLTLVFRAYAPQSRPFRFPKHFDMSAADPDGEYEFPPESSAGNGTEVREISQRGATAPGRLEMTGEVAEHDDVVAAPGAETSGSPIDTEDYDAVVRETALVAAAMAASPDTQSLHRAPATNADEDEAQLEAYLGQLEADDGAAPSQMRPTSPGAAESHGASDDFEKVLECNISTEDNEDAGF